MKIVLTAGEIMDRGLWDKFCNLRGINEWAMNEGQMTSDEEFTFTKEEAIELGLITEKE